LGEAMHHVACERTVHFGDLLLLGRQDRSDLVGQFAGTGTLGATLLHLLAKLLALGAASFHLGLPLGTERLELLPLCIGQVESVSHLAELLLAPLGAVLSVGALHPLAAQSTLAATAARAVLGGAHRALGTGEQFVFLSVGERRRERHGDGPEVAALGLVAEGVLDERDLLVGQIEGLLQPLGAVGAVLRECGQREDKEDSEEHAAPQGSVLKNSHRSVRW